MGPAARASCSTSWGLCEAGWWMCASSHPASQQPASKPATAQNTACMVTLSVNHTKLLIHIKSTFLLFNTALGNNTCTPRGRGGVEEHSVGGKLIGSINVRGMVLHAISTEVKMEVACRRAFNAAT